VPTAQHIFGPFRHHEIFPVISGKKARLTSNGKYAFVALVSANHVAVIDAKTYEVPRYLVVGRRAWHLGLTPDEKLLFATNGVSGDITVVDDDDLKAIKSIKVGRDPWEVAIKPLSDALRY
jgi:YVTN family beta-propeller protein